MSAVTDRVLFYASGNGGPEVRADGQGGVLSRGWYQTNGDGKPGQDVPVFATEAV